MSVVPLFSLRRLVVGLAVVSAGVTGSASHLGAQAGPAAALPSADEIFATYRKAIGGEAAIRQYSYRTVRGVFEIRAQGMKGDLVVLAAAPNLMTLTVTLPGLGEMRRGYDGEIGWSLDPAIGPRLLDGRELAELRHSADFYEDLHDSTRYASVTVVGQTTFDGRDCYEVKTVREAGFEVTEFFDVRTGLLAGVKMNASSQMGAVPVTTLVSDYTEFGGILTPTVTRQLMMGLESVTTISSVTFEPIDASAFELPDQIAALAAQR